jgi:hypothetical protein
VAIDLNRCVRLTKLFDQSFRQILLIVQRYDSDEQIRTLGKQKAIPNAATYTFLLANSEGIVSFHVAWSSLDRGRDPRGGSVPAVPFFERVETRMGPA